MPSPLDRARAAVRSAAGTPVLFRAALEAGVSPVEATDVLAASAAALGVAARRADGTPGRQNAMRHFVWQAYLAARWGERVATALAMAQERGREGTADSEIDARNNAVGLAYGLEHAADLRARPRPAALALLADVAAQKWRTGELVWL